MTQQPAHSGCQDTASAKAALRVTKVIDHVRLWRHAPSTQALPTDDRAEGGGANSNLNADRHRRECAQTRAARSVTIVGRGAILHLEGTAVPCVLRCAMMLSRRVHRRAAAVGRRCSRKRAVISSGNRGRCRITAPRPHGLGTGASVGASCRPGGVRGAGRRRGPSRSERLHVRGCCRFVCAQRVLSRRLGVPTASAKRLVVATMARGSGRAARLALASSTGGA